MAMNPPRKSYLRLRTGTALHRSRRPADGGPSRWTTSITALKDHRIRQNERRLVVGAVWQDHDMVFASDIGTPIDHSNVYHRFVALVKKTDVPRISFQGLRHTYATLLMKHGVHPKVASE